jgi:hypothetical protein
LHYKTGFSTTLFRKNPYAFLQCSSAQKLADLRDAKEEKLSDERRQSESMLKTRIAYP